jgi:hypothetical protein
MPPTALLVRAAEALDQLKRHAATAGAPAVPGGAPPRDIYPMSAKRRCMPFC